MTPAVRQLQRMSAAHRVLKYDHDPHAASYGLEAAAALGVPPAQVFKTLIVELSPSRQRFVVAIVPVSTRLDLKAMAQVCGAKRAAMANTADAERVTGYVVGGISPFGQKRSLPVFLDRSAEQFGEIYVSAGKRGIDIALAPDTLISTTHARTVPIAVTADGSGE